MEDVHSNTPWPHFHNLLKCLNNPVWGLSVAHTKIKRCKKFKSSLSPKTAQDGGLQYRTGFWRNKEILRKTSQLNKQIFSKNTRKKEEEEAPPCLPSPPGSCPSPGCWCRGRVSPSSRWGRRRRPDRPAGHRDSCGTEATQRDYFPFPNAQSHGGELPTTQGR